MQWLAISENWTAHIPAVMQRWPEAREEDLIALDGTREGLANYLALRTQRPPEEIDDEIEAWRAGEVPSDIRMDETRDMENISATERYLPEGEDVFDDDSAFGDEGNPDTPVGRTG